MSPLKLLNGLIVNPTPYGTFLTGVFFPFVLNYGIAIWGRSPGKTFSIHIFIKRTTYYWQTSFKRTMQTCVQILSNIMINNVASTSF